METPSNADFCGIPAQSSPFPQVRVFVEWIAELFERCPLLTNQEDVIGRWHSSASATLRPNSRPEQSQECMPEIIA
jgi:hypothetical protein